MSKSVMKINIAKDFSDGKNSGEVFLKNLLIPAITTHDEVEIDFDGVRGYGSSFLEEAFGGLIRLTGMSVNEFKAKVKILSRDPYLLPEINSYVQDADRAFAK